MIETMPRKLPLYVVREKTRHKTIVYYFREGKGPRTRLPGDPNSQEFKAAYQTLLAGRPIFSPPSNAPVRSLRWLVDRYHESGRWTQLSASTRKWQDRLFEKMLQISGNVDARAVQPSDIRRMLDEKRATPSLANNYLKALSALFKWALVNEHVTIDPTAGVDRLKVKSDGFPAWTIDDAKRFREIWPIGSKPRLAFELLLHTGLRRSDICRLGRQHLSGRILTVRTYKTGTNVTIELPQSLLDIIAKTKVGDLHFIVGEFGRPFTVESFGNWFRDQCRACNIHKSAHGIRKLSATMAANAGATTHELMAQYGWVTTQQAEVYTKGADRARLGVRTSRLVAEQIEAMEIPHLVSGAGKTEKKQRKSTTKKLSGVHERIRTSDPRIHTTSAFAAAAAFVVWTVPSPWTRGSLGAARPVSTPSTDFRPSLGSGLACWKTSEAFPDFEQIRHGVSVHDAQF